MKPLAMLTGNNKPIPIDMTIFLIILEPMLTDASREAETMSMLRISGRPFVGNRYNPLLKTSADAIKTQGRLVWRLRFSRVMMRVLAKKKILAVRMIDRRNRAPL